MSDTTGQITLNFGSSGLSIGRNADRQFQLPNLIRSHNAIPVRINFKDMHDMDVTIKHGDQTIGNYGPSYFDIRSIVSLTGFTHQLCNGSDITLKIKNDISSDAEVKTLRVDFDVHYQVYPGIIIVQNGGASSVASVLTELPRGSVPTTLIISSSKPITSASLCPVYRIDLSQSDDELAWVDDIALEPTDFEVDGKVGSRLKIDFADPAISDISSHLGNFIIKVSHAKTDSRDDSALYRYICFGFRGVSS